MDYATQQDLIDRFGTEELIELTDRADPPAGAIDATVVARALADAGDAIDSYIARRYDLPLPSTPGRLTRIACDLARYFLHADDPTEAVETAYKDAIQFLRDVADGRAVLDIAGAEPAASSAGAPEVSGPGRVFSRDTMEGF